ncbi:TatD family hydrolase [Algivirga pacifica]|uniref:TatD family hydrolase n=2 Tax=Algivirga pacifica TaxID=1162670 RepID=A0ABP9D8Y5_9BACT
MPTPTYINIHTHHPSPQGITVLNTFLQEFQENDSQQYQSVGLHPWHIEEHQGVLNNLTKAADRKHVLFIGETGLDRAIDTPFELQKEVFVQHIQCAEQLSKPMIIHAVRSYPDLLQMRKQSKAQQPWVIHGFQGNLQIAQQLLKTGCYLSYGEVLFKNRPKVIEAFLQTPIDRLFLETDDKKELSIQQVYEQAAQLKEIPIFTLIERISSNFRKLALFEG